MLRAVLCGLCLIGFSVPAAWAQEPGHSAKGKNPVERVLLLPPGPGNPRNSEGDFIRLRDGRLLFIYTHFTGKSNSDFGPAYLAARESRDGGRTWSREDRRVVANEGGMNVMSVSLLRLQDGRIALFYLRKNSLKDCRPLVRFSTDEAKTWSKPRYVIQAPVGYYVLNNDRVVQLRSGRLVVPVSVHNLPQYKKPDWLGQITCYLSDDGGRSWRRSRSMFKGYDAQGKRLVTQEPGVVELADGTLLLYCRTNGGSQYVSYSRDGGETWSKLQPSQLVSPVSPATIKRIPGTGDLLAVWNDHSQATPQIRGKRTPLVVAISRDQGRTWIHRRVLEDDPTGWYCYTAVEFVGDYVLLGHCTGSTKKYAHLAMLQVVRFPVAWLYEEP